MSSLPTWSSTRSAPSPPVKSRISCTASGPGATARSAPPRSALSREDSRGSTATIRAAVVALSTWTARWPRPPTPMTTAVETGPSLCCERRTAWYGVSAASVSGAAETGSSPSGSGTRCRAAGTRRYSAIPPSRPSPPPPPGTGARSGRCAQRLVAAQAALALPAAPGADDGDRLAGLEAADALAERVHPAGVLVAEREGRIPRQRAGLEVVHQVQVGVARPGGAHLHQHLTRPRHGDRHLDQLRLALPRRQPQRPHGSSSSMSCGPASR